MKRCLICRKKLKDDYYDLCPLCKRLGWKHSRRNRKGKKSLILFKTGGKNNGKKKLKKKVH